MPITFSSSTQTYPCLFLTFSSKLLSDYSWSSVYHPFLSLLSMFLIICAPLKKCDEYYFRQNLISPVTFILTPRDLARSAILISIISHSTGKNNLFCPVAGSVKSHTAPASFIPSSGIRLLITYPKISS